LNSFIKIDNRRCKVSVQVFMFHSKISLIVIIVIIIVIMIVIMITIIMITTYFDYYDDDYDDYYYDYTVCEAGELLIAGKPRTSKINTPKTNGHFFLLE
jgi:hypothetical protein